MTTPNTLPDTPAAIPGNSVSTGFGVGVSHTAGLNKMLADILNAWLKIGVGAANQIASAAGPGRVIMTRLDGTSELEAPLLVNGLRNGGQERWSIGTSIAVAASVSDKAGYGPDGWCLKTNANQASTIARVTGLTDQSQYASNVKRNLSQTGTGTMVYEEALTTEEIVKYRGKKCSLSLSLKAGANWSPASGNATVTVRCGTGAEGRRGAGFTGETGLISSVQVVTTAVSQPGFVSSVVVPTNATQMSVTVEWAPVGTAGADDSITVDDLVLVPGDVPLPFLFRDPAADRLACLEHYREFGGNAAAEYIGSGFTYDATHGIVGMVFSPMRAAPSVTYSVESDFRLNDGAGTGVTPTAFSFGNVTLQSLVLTVTVAAGLTAGRGTYVVANNTNARIRLDARL